LPRGSPRVKTQFSASRRLATMSPMGKLRVRSDVAAPPTVASRRWKMDAAVQAPADLGDLLLRQQRQRVTSGEDKAKVPQASPGRGVKCRLIREGPRQGWSLVQVPGGRKHRCFEASCKGTMTAHHEFGPKGEIDSPALTWWRCDTCKLEVADESPTRDA
jgi:hypothetical protein